MDAIELTPEQEEDAARIRDVLLAGMRVEAERMARLLASKDDSRLLGETEFRIRDSCHRIGARAIDAALEGRKKGGTAGRAPSVPGAAGR